MNLYKMKRHPIETEQIGARREENHVGDGIAKKPLQNRASEGREKRNNFGKSENVC